MSVMLVQLLLGTPYSGKAEDDWSTNLLCDAENRQSHVLGLSLVSYSYKQFRACGQNIRWKLQNFTRPLLRFLRLGHLGQLQELTRRR